MNREKRVSVLFVCMGNICRSPTAEAVFRRIVEEAGLADVIRIDSAGTHAYHVGNPPDRRAQEAARRRGISLAEIRARRIAETDFEEFDYVIAMDRENLSLLTQQAEERFHERLSLLLEHVDLDVDEVPDPYYGGASGFERVLDLIEGASGPLLEKLRTRHNLT